MKKRLLNSFTVFTAALVLAAPAYADSDHRPVVRALALETPAPAASFETQWAVVDAFIAAHVEFPNDAVRLALKSETLLGLESWLCEGRQLGWPTSIDAPLALGFDTSANAYYCAELIRAINP